MFPRKDYILFSKIAKRAQKMGIAMFDHISQMMDLEVAHSQFSLRLVEFLNADDFNFAHDFCGIQQHIDRKKGVIVDFFVPRFAGKEQTNAE